MHVLVLVLVIVLAGSIVSSASVAARIGARRSLTEHAEDRGGDALAGQ